MKKYSASQNFESLIRTGQPKIITKRDIRRTIKSITERPDITSSELAKETRQPKSQPISPSLIRLELLKRGLRSYSARKTHFLTAKMMKKRLEWCNIHKECGEDYWQNVLFSD